MHCRRVTFPAQGVGGVLISVLLSHDAMATWSVVISTNGITSNNCC